MGHEIYTFKSNGGPVRYSYINYGGLSTLTVRYEFLRLSICSYHRTSYIPCSSSFALDHYNLCSLPLLCSWNTPFLMEALLCCNRRCCSPPSVGERNKVTTKNCLTPCQSICFNSLGAYGTSLTIAAKELTSL